MISSLNFLLLKFSLSAFCVLRLARHRQIAEPEVVAESSEDSDEGTWHPEREESSEDEEEEEVDDEVALCAAMSGSSYFVLLITLGNVLKGDRLILCRKSRGGEQ